MNLLVIRDDKPGHYNQTEGLIIQLKEVYSNLNVEYINIEIKSKIKRKILRFLLNNFTSFFSNEKNLKYLSIFFKKFSLPVRIPDLIISTGGNTSNFNVWLSKVYKSKNILNGALRGLKEELFTNITTVIDLGYKNQIILDVAPNLVTKEKLLIESKKFLNEKNLSSDQKYYTLLIGGNGSGYFFDDEFFNKLIEFIKKISLDENVSWLITTSRRTSIEVERKLQIQLKNVSSYFVSYNQKEEKVLLPFLGLGEKIFVTEESASMISEAISSSKEVYTLCPSFVKCDENYKKILTKFINEKRLNSIIDFNFIEIKDFSPYKHEDQLKLFKEKF